MYEAMSWKCFYLNYLFVCVDALQLQISLSANEESCSIKVNLRENNGMSKYYYIRLIWSCNFIINMKNSVNPEAS